VGVLKTVVDITYKALLRGGLRSDPTPGVVERGTVMLIPISWGGEPFLTKVLGIPTDSSVLVKMVRSNCNVIVAGREKS